jgi:hypothetical protein
VDTSARYNYSAVNVDNQPQQQQQQSGNNQPAGLASAPVNFISSQNQFVEHAPGLVRYNS